MRKKYARILRHLWKRANEITLQQLTEALPFETVGKFAALVLSALAMLPLFVSFSFRMPQKLLADLLDVQYAGTLSAYALGSYWFRCLLTLGFFTGLLTAFQLAKLYYRRKSGLRSEHRSALPVYLCLLLGWSILSAAFSSDPALSFLGDGYRHEGVLTYVLYATVFAAALQLTTRQMRFVVEVLSAVCACTGILVITGGDLIPGLFYLEEDLRAAMFHQYNHYGYFLAICFPLCTGLILQDDNPGPLLMLLRLGQFWLICNAVAFNSVRGSFLSICAMLTAWNVFIPLLHRSRWKRLLVLDLIFLAAVLFLNTGSTLLDRFAFLFQELGQLQPDSTAALDDIGSYRGILWRLGIGFALEKPLFGYGPENLGHLYRSYRADLSDRPHNELIQIAASLGLPALIFYLTGLGSHLISFFRNAKKLSIFELALFASVGGYLVSSLFGNSMYYTTPYFYMLLAFSCRAVQNARSPISHQSP